MVVRQDAQDPVVAVSASGSWCRGKVLVVEDEPEMAALVSFVLRQADFAVVRAADGLEAIQEYEREQPDLVVLDLLLPEVSGFRLLWLFKHSSLGYSTPVIVLTALDFQEVEEVVRLGVDDFLTKPFDPLELVRRVEAVLVCPARAGTRWNSS